MYVASKGFALTEYRLLTNFPRRQVSFKIISTPKACVKERREGRIMLLYFNQLRRFSPSNHFMLRMSLCVLSATILHIHLNSFSVYDLISDRSFGV